MREEATLNVGRSAVYSKAAKVNIVQNCSTIYRLKANNTGHSLEAAPVLTYGVPI
jgi:hypothetical protein